MNLEPIRKLLKELSIIPLNITKDFKELYEDVNILDGVDDKIIKLLSKLEDYGSDIDRLEAEIDYAVDDIEISDIDVDDCQYIRWCR